MRFDRDALLSAFDDIGTAALANGARLQFAVYGESALQLASNFRFSTEDVDVDDATSNQPPWLRDEMSIIARRNGWSDDWLNDAVAVHLPARIALGRPCRIRKFSAGRWPLRT